MSFLYQNLQDWSLQGFSGSSASKESTHNPRDPSSIPGSRSSLEKRQATHSSILGLLSWLRCKKILLQCGKSGFNSMVVKIPQRREQLPNSSILAWRIQWTEKPDRLKSMTLQSPTGQNDFHSGFSELGLVKGICIQRYYPDFFIFTY